MSAAPSRRATRRISKGDQGFRTIGAAAALTLGAALVVVAASVLTGARLPASDEARLLVGTSIAAGVATLFAVPIAMGVALFTVDLGPPRAGRLVGAVVDGLSAVPPVVYGLWGTIAITPRALAASDALLPSATPSARADAAALGSAAAVLAIMIAPTVASVSAQVLRSAPIGVREAAAGLGGTPWDTFVHVVWPRTRGGLLGAGLLGLGRALGEGVAVALVTGSVGPAARAPVTAAGAMLAGLSRAQETGDYRAIGALGLALFAITLLVNVSGRALVDRVRYARSAQP